MRLLLAVIAVLLVVPAEANAATLYLSQDGHDGAQCTSESPCRSIAHADKLAHPRDTVIMRSGDYGAVSRYTYFAKPRVTWQGIGAGEDRPHLLGASVVSGHHVRLTNVIADGPSGPIGANGCNGEDGLVWMHARRTRIDHSEIRESMAHFGVFVDKPRVKVDHNVIRNNGCPQDPNRDHGIYWNRGTGVIQDNLIDNNIAWGIQLYPHPRRVLVQNNTITNNGRGGIILGGSRNAVIANNVIAHNGWSEVNGQGIYCNRFGKNNVALNNIGWDNYGGDMRRTPGCKLTSSDLLHADPLLVLAGDFHLSPGSPAIGFGNPAYATKFDLDDQTRDDAEPDAGADESGADAPTPPTPTPTPTPTPPSCT